MSDDKYNSVKRTMVLSCCNGRANSNAYTERFRGIQGRQSRPRAVQHRKSTSESHTVSESCQQHGQKTGKHRPHMHCRIASNSNVVQRNDQPSSLKIWPPRPAEPPLAMLGQYPTVHKPNKYSLLPWPLLSPGCCSLWGASDAHLRRSRPASAG